MLCKVIDIPVFPAKLCLRNIDSWFSPGWKGGPVRGLRAHPCFLPPEMLSWVMKLGGGGGMNKEHCLSLGFSRAKRSIFFLWSECDKSWGFSLFFPLMWSGLRTKGYTVSEVVRVQSKKYAGPGPVHPYPATQQSACVRMKCLQFCSLGTDWWLLSIRQVMCLLYLVNTSTLAPPLICFLTQLMWLQQGWHQYLLYTIW